MSTLAWLALATAAFAVSYCISAVLGERAKRRRENRW